MDYNTIMERMGKRVFPILFLFLFHIAIGQTDSVDKKLFIYGGNVTKEFIKYTAEITGKKKPKICFLPTASADNERYINYWYRLCSGLNVEPHVLKVWISSHNHKESFGEILSQMDAIVVGGGNTLNMLAIWKAQKIDVVLRELYDNGVVLAGGSAGSLCWFTGGTTDSRPKEMTIIEGLGFLDFSHCPHYHSEKSRKPLYHDNISKGLLDNGYACDDKAGILFINGKMKKSLAMDEESHSYYVHKKDGEVFEEKLTSEIIQ